jgi:hypothetical protein
MDKFEEMEFDSWSRVDRDLLVAILKNATVELGYELPVTFSGQFYNGTDIHFHEGMKLHLTDAEANTTNLHIQIKTRKAYSIWKAFIELDYVKGGLYKKQGILKKESDPPKENAQTAIDVNLSAENKIKTKLIRNHTLAKERALKALQDLETQGKAAIDRDGIILFVNSYTPEQVDSILGPDCGVVAWAKHERKKQRKEYDPGDVLSGYKGFLGDDYARWVGRNKN